jgi:hypothetical protein
MQKTFKIFVFVVITMANTSIHAQKLRQGSVGLLWSEQQLNIVIDYSNTIIAGKTVNGFLERKGISAGDWERIQDVLYRQFVMRFNDHLVGKHDLRGGNFPDAKYTATVKVTIIDSDGEMGADVIFAKTDDNEFLARVLIGGEGGKFGSVENLFSDGFRRAGDNLGKFMAKQLK